MALLRFPLPLTAPAPGPLVATVSVLNALEPVAMRLRAVFADSDVDRRLALEGRLAVFEGPPEEARGVERALRALGLTTSLNLRPVPVEAPHP